jgi:hypothetical protein
MVADFARPPSHVNRKSPPSVPSQKSLAYLAGPTIEYSRYSIVGPPCQRRRITMTFALGLIQSFKFSGRRQPLFQFLKPNVLIDANKRNMNFCMAIHDHGFSAAAFSPAMRPKAIASGMLLPPGYRNPKNEHSSPGV